jgi:hypothetical protein
VLACSHPFKGGGFLSVALVVVFGSGAFELVEVVGDAFAFDYEVGHAHGGLAAAGEGDGEEREHGRGAYEATHGARYRK